MKPFVSSLRFSPADDFSSWVQIVSTRFAPSDSASAPAVVSGSLPIRSPASDELTLRLWSPCTTPFSSTYCESNRSAAAALPSGSTGRVLGHPLAGRASAMPLMSAQKEANPCSPRADMSVLNLAFSASGLSLLAATAASTSAWSSDSIT